MIPTSIISKLNQKEAAISFGSITLKIVKHDGHKTRYLWTEESSEVLDSPTSGECDVVISRNNRQLQTGMNKGNE